MSGIVELVLFILFALGFAWLTWRAWRLRQLAPRVIAGVLAALVTLVLTAVSVLGLVGAYRLYTPHGAPAVQITAQASADQLSTAARRANGCAGCHSSTDALPLNGGSSNFLGGPMGVLFAPNLTPGGPLSNWSDGEIVRAIREGVDRDGHPLITMPSDSFHNLSDTDAQSLVAYLHSQPAASTATPPRDLSLMALALIGAGLFPTAVQPPISQAQSAPPPGVTPQYGGYLIAITGCRTCHGANLEGGASGGFGPPPGPNIRTLVPTWQVDAFVSFFRTGVDPYARSIDPDAMPWKDIGAAYIDDELRAMYAYFKSPS